MTPEAAWLGAILFLLVYELWALARKQRLLSHAVWDFLDKYPALGRLTILALGILLGHLYW